MTLRLSTLSGASFYREYRPAPDLAPFVACTWVRFVGAESDGQAAPIIPDGCTDVIVVADNAPHIAGPDAETRWIKLRAGVVISGVRLRPGASRAVFRCDAREIVHAPPLADVARGAMALHGDLRAVDEIGLRHRLLEQWVRDALAARRGDEREMLAACAGLLESGIDIDTLAQRLGWSTRTMHRRFLATCGYGPKHLQRIMRVQRALRHMQTPTDRRLAEAAHKAGFADQAHMTRDFRAITGFTPGAYLTFKAPEYGAWLEGDWREAEVSETFKTRSR